MNRPLSPLVATHLAQCIPQQLPFLLFMRAEVDPDVVVEHLPASSRPLPFLHPSSRVTLTQLSLPPLFNFIRSHFCQQQSPHKNFKISLVLSLQKASLKIVRFPSQRHEHQDENQLTLHKKNHTFAIALNKQKIKGNSAQKKLKEQATCVTAVAGAYKSVQLETKWLGSKNDGLKLTV